MPEGKYEITIYTSCCNADKGIYYYTTYDNHQISAVDMHKENLEAKELIRYSPLKKSRYIFRTANKIYGRDFLNVHLCNPPEGYFFFQYSKRKDMKCRLCQTAKRQRYSDGSKFPS